MISLAIAVHNNYVVYMYVVEVCIAMHMYAYGYDVTVK